MRSEGLNLIAYHTRNILYLLCGLIQHRGGELSVDDPANISLIIVAVDCHYVIHQLKGVAKEILGIVHDELIVAHATIGLRDSHVLIEFITVSVLNDDLNGESTRTDTDGCHFHLHVLVDLHVLKAVTIIFRINAVILGLSIQGLAHQLLTGNVHITQISQRRHTELAIAIVLKGTVRYLVIILFVIIWTEEVDPRMTI